MTRDADIVVVGAGITGAATARALAQAGRGVLLVEQFEPGHDRGSSHGTSRIFRLSYPDQHFVRLAQGALQSWRELEAECEEQLVVWTGALDFGPVALENARALAASGVRHELLTDGQVRARWPIAAEPGEPILFHPDAGVILAGRAWDVLIAGAVDNGALLLPNLRVTGIREQRGSVRVTTSGEDIVARACVVAAGAWARSLLDGAGVELPVIPTRETVTYFHLPGALELPPVIDDAVPDPEEHGLRRPGLINYALAAPGRGLKAGLHHAGPPTDPDDPARPTRRSCAGSRRGSRGATSQLEPDPIASETCIYTNTADESFVLERHGRIVVASMCSGHGFKFAPFFGRTLAGLARDAAG